MSELHEHISHLIKHHSDSNDIHVTILGGVRCILILDTEETTNSANRKSPTRVHTHAHVVGALQPHEHAHTHTRKDKTSFSWSKRRTTPGEIKREKYKKKDNPNYPSEREWQLAGIIMEKISDNYPGIITESQLAQKIEAGAITIHKLAKKYDFKLIKDTMLWAVADPFWKKQFRSISRVTEPSKRNNNTKFENMAMSYQESTKSEIDELSEYIEQYVNQKYFEDNDSVQQVLDDILWFQDKVDAISISLSKKSKFYWHTDIKFLSVAKWLVDLDFRIIQQKDINNFQDLMKRYLQFLENRLQKNDIETLHAGMFSDKSVLFRGFINDLSDQWGSDILQD